SSSWAAVATVVVATVTASRRRATCPRTPPTSPRLPPAVVPETTTSRSSDYRAADPAPGDEEPAQHEAHGLQPVARAWAVDRLFARYTPRSPCSAGTFFGIDEVKAVDGT